MIAHNPSGSSGFAMTRSSVMKDRRISEPTAGRKFC
jgi:hypothetical protein